MRADREQALGHGPIAIGEGALDDGVGRQRGLQLAPYSNAFEQRAAFIDARQAVTERGVHMEVRVDEMRSQQVAAGIDSLVRQRLQPRRHLGDLAALHGDGDAGAAVGQGCVGDKEVEHDGLIQRPHQCRSEQCYRPVADASTLPRSFHASWSCVSYPWKLVRFCGHVNLQESEIYCSNVS